QEVVASDTTLTQPVLPTYYTATAQSGQDVSGEDFGNFKNITVTGQVYNDLNGNGSGNNGSDPGLSAVVQLYLDTNANGSNGPGLIASLTTGPAGTYSFPNLGPGAYHVQEVVPDGWLLTHPDSPGGNSFTAASGQDVGGQDFGNFQTLTVSGRAF